MSEYEIVVKFILTLIIGGLIGYERKSKNRPAGFTTHILVCLGAMIIAIIQLYVLEDTINAIKENPSLKDILKVDSGRIISKVVSGIGFLGAGSIIHTRNSVKGLTTAATLWVTASIGLAIGMGYYFLSIVSTVFVYFTLIILKKFEYHIVDKSKRQNIKIEYKDEKKLLRNLSQYFTYNKIKIENIEFFTDNVYNKKLCEYKVLIPYELDFEKVIEAINKFEDVLDIVII